MEPSFFPNGIQSGYSPGARVNNLFTLLLIRVFFDVEKALSFSDFGGFKPPKSENKKAFNV